MSYVRSNNNRFAYKEYEPPTKKIISDGDILIKNLVNKQQTKDICLQEYLEKKQNFEKHSEQLSFTSCSSGKLSLEQFRTAVKQLEEIEDLKACNLTNEDVRLLFDYRNGKIYEKYKNIDPEILQAKISRILKTIREYNKTSHKEGDCNEKTITHKQNEALALKPNSTETKLLKFALENQNVSSAIFPHPMDHVKDLSTNLFSHLHQEKLIPSKIQKQIRRYANKINTVTSTETNQPNVNEQYKKLNHNFVEDSKWDQHFVESTKSKPEIYIQKIYSCIPQNYYTIRNGEIVKLTSCSTINELKIDRAHQLTVDEIRAIPKFKDYMPGLPSKTLYLKNLPKNVREADLQEVFSIVPCGNPILYRIMTGKMKGQAFVTFSDIESASKALNLINGTHINEKPIIIEFGKR